MATYTITLKNKSNVDRQFLLFQDMPLPDNAPSSGVFSNVYQRSPLIQSGDGSNTSFSMSQEYWAVYGTASKSGDGKVRVTTSDSQKVKLGPNGTMVGLTTINKNGTDPSWDSSVSGSTQAKGGFSIQTDTSFKFPNPNAIYIGCGAKDPKNSDNIIPIQSYLAEPGLNNQLFPKSKYYICFGRYEPGTVVDRVTLGKVLQIDFSGAAIPTAVFTLTNQGTYEADDSVGQNGVKWSYDTLSGA